LTFLLTQEMDPSMFGEREKEHIPIKLLLKSLFQNKYALLLLLMMVATQLVTGILQTGGTYFYTYYLGNQSYMSAVMLWSLIPWLLSMIFLPKFLKRVGLGFGWICLASSIIELIAFFTCGPYAILPLR